MNKQHYGELDLHFPVVCQQARELALSFKKCQPTSLINATMSAFVINEIANLNEEILFKAASECLADKRPTITFSYRHSIINDLSNMIKNDALAQAGINLTP